MGRQATVLSIWTGDFDATGLPEPLGLFLDKKTGKKKNAPLAPLLGGSPSRQVTLVYLISSVLLMVTSIFNRPSTGGILHP